MENLKILTNKITVGKFAGFYFFSRNQAHIFHLQSKTLSKHFIFKDYYKGVLDKIDRLVESYQGSNPVVIDYSNKDLNYISFTPENAINYFNSLLEYLDKNKGVFGDLNVEMDSASILAELRELIRSTLNKIKNYL